MTIQRNRVTTSADQWDSGSAASDSDGVPMDLDDLIGGTQGVTEEGTDFDFTPEEEEGASQFVPVGEAANRAGLNNTTCEFFERFVIGAAWSSRLTTDVIQFFQSHRADDVSGLRQLCVMEATSPTTLDSGILVLC